MGIDFSGDDYNSPRLIINYFKKSNQINFYITDAADYSSNTEVQLVFNNEKGTILSQQMLLYRWRNCFFRRIF